MTETLKIAICKIAKIKYSEYTLHFIVQVTCLSPSTFSGMTFNTAHNEIGRSEYPVVS